MQAGGVLESTSTTRLGTGDSRSVLKLVAASFRGFAGTVPGGRNKAMEEGRNVTTSHCCSQSPLVLTFAIPEGSFGAGFQADYESQMATWPDLENTTDFRDFERFVTSAHWLVRKWLDPELVARLERFAYDPLEPAAIVIKGFPVDAYVPPTGKDCFLQKAGNYVSETLLVGISRIIGQPYSMEFRPNASPSGVGFRVRNVHCIPGYDDEVNRGSSAFLDFHVDFFQLIPERFPQVLAFMGIRGDSVKVGRTLLCDFHKIYARLDPSEIKVLREEKITWDLKPTACD